MQGEATARSSRARPDGRDRRRSRLARRRRTRRAGRARRSRRASTSERCLLPRSVASLGRRFGGRSGAGMRSGVPVGPTRSNARIQARKNGVKTRRGHHRSSAARPVYQQLTLDACSSTPCSLSRRRTDSSTAMPSGVQSRWQNTKRAPHSRAAGRRRRPRFPRAARGRCLARADRGRVPRASARATRDSTVRGRAALRQGSRKRHHGIRRRERRRERTVVAQAQVAPKPHQRRRTSPPDSLVGRPRVSTFSKTSEEAIRWPRSSPTEYRSA